MEYKAPVMDTVAIKDVRKEYIRVETNMAERNGPLESLQTIDLIVEAPNSASYSNQITGNPKHDQLYESFKFTMKRHPDETGHAFRLRAIQAMDALGASYVRGKMKQRDLTRNFFGI